MQSSARCSLLLSFCAHLQALKELDQHSNAVLAGDLNWDDKAQGLLALPSTIWWAVLPLLP